MTSFLSRRLLKHSQTLFKLSLRYNKPGPAGDVKLLAGGNGYFTMFRESNIPPNTGPPLHIHPKSTETFFIEKGTFKFKVENEEFIVTEGGTAVVQPGLKHAWKNVGNINGNMLFIFTPHWKGDNESNVDFMEIMERNEDLIITGPPL